MTKQEQLIEKQRELINYLKHHYDVNSPLWDDQCVTSLKMEAEIKQLESEQEQLIKKQREKILNILINNIHLLSDDSYTYGLEEDDFDCISNEILTALEAEIAKEKDVPKMSAEEVLQILDIDLYDHEIPNIVKAMMLYANQFKQ
jgi:hypothetical protein